MMRGAAISLLALGIAGCTSGPPGASLSVPAADARPAEVILYRDTATVRFDDGALCTAVRPGSAPRWSGTLDGCPHPWPYAVARPAPRGHPRQPLREGAGGDVTLQSPDGRSIGYGWQPPEA